MKRMLRVIFDFTIMTSTFLLAWPHLDFWAIIPAAIVGLYGLFCFWDGITSCR